MKKMLGVLLAGVMAGVLVSGLILANPGTTQAEAKTNKKTKWLAGKSFFNAGPSQKTISKWVKKVG